MTSYALIVFLVLRLSGHFRFGPHLILNWGIRVQIPLFGPVRLWNRCSTYKLLMIILDLGSDSFLLLTNLTHVEHLHEDLPCNSEVVNFSLMIESDLSVLIDIVQLDISKFPINLVLLHICSSHCKNVLPRKERTYIISLTQVAKICHQRSPSVSQI